ncbi:MAG: YgiT-type zinc finger protein [Candidatus Entotheonellia bacterium]
MKMAADAPCEFCEGTVEHRQIRARFHFKGDTIYTDNVPAWVCVRCGEHYFDAPVYKRLEAIARQREHIEKQVCFPLADYEMTLL